MKKRADYTTNPEFDAHENFKRSSEIASWFSNKNDKSYAILIGTKLARLGSLLSSDRKPNNESVDDTFEDLINYCALWAERRTEDRKTQNERQLEQMLERNKEIHISDEFRSS